MMKKEKKNQGVLKPPSVGAHLRTPNCGALCSISDLTGRRASWVVCFGLPDRFDSLRDVADRHLQPEAL